MTAQIRKHRTPRKLVKILCVTGNELYKMWPRGKDGRRLEPVTFERRSEIQDPDEYKYGEPLPPEYFVVEHLRLGGFWPLGAKVRVTVELLKGKNKHGGANHN